MRNVPTHPDQTPPVGCVNYAGDSFFVDGVDEVRTTQAKCAVMLYPEILMRCVSLAISVARVMVLVTCLLLLAISTVLLTGCGDEENSKIEDLSGKGYAFSVADFHRAAAAGDVDALEWFLGAGMDPNVQGTNGDTALLSAIRAGSGEATSYLLDRAADARAVRGAEGRNGLMIASHDGSEEVVQVLLSKGAYDPVERDRNGYHALALAISNGHNDVVDLLAARANRDMLDDGLLMAAVLGDVNTADLLLSRGASVLARDANGRTPLMHAAKRGNVEMVRLLMDNGSNRYAVDGETGATAGQMADELLNQSVGENAPAPRLQDQQTVVALLNREPGVIEAEVAGTLVDKRELLTVNSDGSLPLAETPELRDQVRVGERLNGAVIELGEAGIITAKPVVGDEVSGEKLRTELTMREYRTKPLPVIVERVDADNSAEMRLLYGDHQKVYVREGEQVAQLPLEVVSVKRLMRHSKDTVGALADVSKVRLRNTQTGRVYELTTGLEATAGAPYAVLERPTGALFKAEAGDKFGVAIGESERFHVIDVRADAVVIEDVKTREVIVLPRKIDR